MRERRRGLLAIMHRLATLNEIFHCLIWMAAACNADRLVQPPYPPASGARAAVAPDAITLMVRSSRGDGTRLFAVESPASGTVADVKRLLCHPPHSLCSDASALVLLLKGKCPTAT